MSEGPNYQLSIIKARHAIMQQETMEFKCTLDIMEAIARIDQAKENREAHKRAVAEHKKQLADLEETHGSYDTKDVDAAAEEAIAAGAD